MRTRAAAAMGDPRWVSLGVSLSLPRALGHEQRQTPRLHDLPALVQALPLLHHHASVLHGALGDGVGAASDGAPNTEQKQKLPFEANEGKNGERRLRRPPAQAGGDADR